MKRDNHPGPATRDSRSEAPAPPAPTRLGRYIGIDELVLIIGFALLAIGGWMAWPPLAFIAPGLGCCWLALPSRRPFLVRPEACGRREGRH